MFTTGGVPSIYAGDEVGYRGVKEDRAGGDDAVRPEFTTPPGEIGGEAADVLNLHRYLIGLRRRHPWLHEARTSALRLENRCYVYEARHGDDALIAAFNLEDTPAPLPVAELTGRPAEVLAGAGAPPREVVRHTEIAPHGWLILAPR
jgi:glycosidase